MFGFQFGVSFVVLGLEVVSAKLGEDILRDYLNILILIDSLALNCLDISLLLLLALSLSNKGKLLL